MSQPVVLVLRALGLGDLLTGLPALRALRAVYPRHRLVLAAPRSLRPLALHCGAVDQVADSQGLKPLSREVHGASIAVNLHGNGPESHRLLASTRPRRLLAFGHAEVPETSGMPSWNADEHEVERWCRLLVESGIPASSDDLDVSAPPARAPRAAVGATLIHAGAAYLARRWPPERFAAVARAERARGRRVVLTGTENESQLVGLIARSAGLPGDCVLAGRTNLLALAAAVAVAKRVICGDTGIAHLATALGTPSVVLFGPTPPTRWGPPPDRPRHRVLWAGRTGDPHGPSPDPGLLAIEASDVVTAIDELDRLSGQWQ